MSILPFAVSAAIKGCLLACTISVTPGNYGPLALNGLTPPFRATVDLTGSTFTSIYVSRSAHLVLRHGTVANSATAARCWIVDFSRDITLAAAVGAGYGFNYVGESPDAC